MTDAISIDDPAVLTRLVVSLLEDSQNARRLGDQTMAEQLKARCVRTMRRMDGICFVDWAAEHINYPREVAEMALAHAVGDKIEAAHRRGDLFNKRRLLMDDWARFCKSHKSSRQEVSSKSELASRAPDS